MVGATLFSTCLWQALSCGCTILDTCSYSPRLRWNQSPQRPTTSCCWPTSSSSSLPQPTSLAWLDVLAPPAGFQWVSPLWESPPHSSHSQYQTHLTLSWQIFYSSPFWDNPNQARGRHFSLSAWLSVSRGNGSVTPVVKLGGFRVVFRTSMYSPINIIKSIGKVRTGVRGCWMWTRWIVIFQKQKGQR